MRSLARRLTADPNEADDVVQETWLRAIDARGPDEGGAWKTWLARTVRRAAWSRRRAERRRLAREVHAARAEWEHDEAGLLEVQHRVVSAVLELSEPYRTTLVQRYYEDRTPTEIAERAGLSVDTVKTRLKRGLAQLRSTLSADDGQGEGARAQLALVALAAGPDSLRALGAVSLARPAACVACAVIVGSVALLPLARPWSEPERVAVTAPASPDAPVLDEARPATALVPPPAAPAQEEDERAPAADARQTHFTEYWEAVARARESAPRLELTDEQLAPYRRLDEVRVQSLRLEEEESLRRATEIVSLVTAVPIEVDESAELGAFDAGALFTLRLDQPLRLSDVLGLLADQAGRNVVWVVEDGAPQFVDRDLARPDALDFAHNVADFLVDPADYFPAGADTGALFPPAMVNDLIARIRDNVAVGAWDYVGVGIEARGGRIHVRHAAPVQQEVQRFLDHLRKFFVPGPRRRPGSAAGSYEGQGRERALLARLGEVRLAANFGAAGEPMPLEEVGLFLATVTGINVVYGSGYDGDVALEDREVSLHRERTTVLELLDALVADKPSLRWVLRHGCVQFQSKQEPAGTQRLELFDLRDLLRRAPVLAPDEPGRVSALGRLHGRFGAVPLTEDVLAVWIRETILPGSWDEDPANSLRITDGGVLELRHVPRAREAVRELVRDLSRATRGQ